MLDTDELTMYMRLKGMMLPELGSRRTIDVSRSELIAALEATLTRHRSDVIRLSKRKLKTIEKCLDTAYLHLDAVLDDVPLRFACAPRSIQNVEPDMFATFMREKPIFGLASWGMNLDESLMHRFLCDWACLEWWELVVGYGTGILLIPCGGNDGYERHCFELPEWITPVEQAIRNSKCALTVMELSALVSVL